MGFVKLSYYNNKQEKKVATIKINNDDTLEIVKIEDPKIKQPVISENKNLNNKNKNYGIGEVIASITKLFGFKPCAPCNKRRKYLNQITPNWLEKIITKIYEHGKTKNKK